MIESKHVSLIFIYTLVSQSIITSVNFLYELPVIIYNDIPFAMNQVMSYRIFDLGLDVTALYTGGYRLFTNHVKKYHFTDLTCCIQN